MIPVLDMELRRKIIVSSVLLAVLIIVFASIFILMSKNRNTCSRLGGVICGENETCGSFINASDSIRCCSAGCAKQQEPSVSCNESWQCSAWSECDNSRQSRTCSDARDRK